MFGKTDAQGFQPRASFELTDDDLEAARHGVVPDLSRYPQPPRSAAQRAAADAAAKQWQEWKEKYPDMLQHFTAFATAASNKRVAVFLDYDGTLAPIVNDPDRAFMSEEMRDAVRRVAQLFPTAIISGRGREKVEAFVQLRELYYAGSHGMDIVGPANQSHPANLAFQPAAKYEPVMNEVFAKLQDGVRHIAGSSVEHNKFCVSVHFRNCQPACVDDVYKAVEAVLAQYTDLQMSRGRKVLEIKPRVDWDKGTALVHLLRALHLDNPSDVLAIYIGDDRTDEDAFRELAALKIGFGILVSSKVKPTVASYTLQDPAAVQQFLQQLISWGATHGNRWHQDRRCNGWELTAVNGKQIEAVASAAAAPCEPSLLQHPATPPQNSGVAAAAAAAAALQQHLHLDATSRRGPGASAGPAAAREAAAQFAAGGALFGSPLNDLAGESGHRGSTSSGGPCPPGMPVKPRPPGGTKSLDLASESR